MRDVVHCFEEDKGLEDVLGISYVDKNTEIKHNAE